MSEESSLSKKIALIGSIIGLYGTVAGGIYFMEDRFVLRQMHDQEIASVKQESLGRIDHVTSLSKMKLIDIEIDLTKLMIDSKMSIPVSQRSSSYDSDIKELELKLEFLIKHKSYGENRND